MICELWMKVVEKDLEDIHSAKLIIFLGTNDAKNLIPLATFADNYEKMISTILVRNKNTQLFLTGILPRKDLEPSIINSYNQIIKMTTE